MSMDRDFAAFTSANLTEYFGKHFVTANVAKKGYCVHEKGRRGNTSIFPLPGQTMSKQVSFLISPLVSLLLFEVKISLT